MDVNYFAYAVPVFLGAMAVEAAATRKRPVYVMTDFFANLGCGMGSQLAGLVLGALGLAAYAFFYEHARVVTWGESPLAVAGMWALALVGVDLCYYWYHRLSHEVNLFWGTHVVHHQSEEYNLSVALRQPWFTGIYAWAFYVPLALLGVPPLAYALSYAINLLYQFMIHTRTVRTLGPLEAVLNTPSHHRVHHGSNHDYLDRNYAGILIIWDRLFGTFVPETVAAEFGLVKPLHSFNPLWANVHVYVDLIRETRGWSFVDRLKIWVKNPGWRPGDRSRRDATERARGRVYQKHVVAASRAARLNVFVQFLAVLAVTVLVMAQGPNLPMPTNIAIAVFAVACMALWQPILAGNRAARRGQLVLLTTVVAAVGYADGSESFGPWRGAVLAAVAVYVVVSVASILWLNREGA